MSRWYLAAARLHEHDSDTEVNNTDSDSDATDIDAAMEIIDPEDVPDIRRDSNSA